MQTELIRELNNVLNKFPQFWNDAELHRNMVIDAISNKQPDVIKALVENEKIKSVYGTDLDGIFIFDAEKLCSLLKYKEYWENSFTKYRNKIGLTSEGKYLDDSSDVVLDFPFKDCVLEGGMTKEDQGKDEIYFNEIIARDEIDRLFDPKLFINSRRYYRYHIDENITDFSDEDNLIIKGNNLIALHSLKDRYAGKVKLIFIDPPYNTGSDSFKYNDRFNRSTWLTFIKNRLEVARNLLSDDGMIFIQCDDNEQAYLKVLMDDIFLEKNFVSSIVVKMSHLSGVKMSHRDRNIPKTKEFVLSYAKNKDFIRLNETFQDAEWEDVLDRYTKFLIVDEKQPENIDCWKVTNLKDAIDENVKNKDKKNVEKFKIVNAGRIFRTARNKSNQVLDIPKQKKFSKIVTPTGLEKIIYNQEEVIFASNAIRNNKVVTPIGDIWNDIGINNLHNEGGVEFELGKKPEKLIQRIINLGSNEHDIVLDFHLGSGTTAAVAHKMGRRYIGIEQMEYINNITVPRLQKVIDGEQGGISKDINWQGGGSFVYSELMELNAYFVHEIQKAQSTEELEKLFSVMRTEAHLNYRVALENVLFAEYEMDGIPRKVAFSELELNEQKQLLIEILDKNQLYVNASEMDDSDLNISESDKAFTRSFYGKE